MNKLVNLLVLIVASNHLCLAAVFEVVTGEKMKYCDKFT